MIRFIAHIEEQTGKIVRIEFPQRDVPPEGVNGDIRIVYVTDDNLPSEECGKNLRHFIDEYWWNRDFVWLGKKPNKHAIWNFYSSKWEWDADLILQDIRVLRNSKLKQSDWTQLPDSPLTDEKKAEWSKYRQALRDLPNSDISDPNLIQWPQSPED